MFTRTVKQRDCEAENRGKDIVRCFFKNKEFAQVSQKVEGTGAGVDKYCVPAFLFFHRFLSTTGINGKIKSSGLPLKKYIPLAMNQISDLLTCLASCRLTD
jgi:hypothetical protein